ncbi:EamA family transporter [Pseudomonas helleri]|uniref:EamA family transporter n=1 Tax=Pseudomonas helleri TaxID=1608996 RepID=UPI003FD4D87B
MLIELDLNINNTEALLHHCLDFQPRSGDPREDSRLADALEALASAIKDSMDNITSRNLTWLGLSGVTTALSWIFYYKALKAGDVATVALIDKGSVVVAMLLAGLVLREIITLRMIAGAGLIVAGLLVIAKKP